VSSNIHKKVQAIKQQISDTKTKNTECKNALRKNQQLLEQMQALDSLYHSLSRILKHANNVERFSASKLLWGEDCSAEQAKQNSQRLASVLQNRKQQHEQALQQRNTLKLELARLELLLITLHEQRLESQEELEERQTQFIVERKIKRRSSSADTLPWSDQRSDAFRLKAVMLATLCLAALAGYLIPQWQLPPQDRSKYVKIPERIAKLIMEKAQPPPPKPKVEKKPEEEIKPPEKVRDKPTVKKEKIKVARKVAEKTGLLAFKNDFLAIIDAASDMKMGAQAVLSNKSSTQRSSARSTAGSGGRSLVTSQIDLSTGGTNTASINRQNISADNNLKEVVFSHVESKIDKAKTSASQDKQIEQDKLKPTRSDEEIQVVFDRYKDALYRIYNRELRKQPLLKGQLVLRLTIESSGKVSKCVIDSSELDAPSLEKKIVARILKFNFGEKSNVGSMTILYPIDFLPAS
jgi:outer membrane biosynthesis protein TonB